MTRRSSSQRGRRLPAVAAVLMLLAIATAPPVASGSDKPLGDRPAEKQLAMTIEAFLEDQAAEITNEPSPLHGRGLELTRNFAALAAAGLRALSGWRGTLRDLKIEYERPEVDVEILDVAADGDVLTVLAVERTKLHFRKIHGDEPDHQAYEADHVFTFRSTPEGWQLESHALADPDAIPPVTDPLAAAPMAAWEPVEPIAPADPMASSIVRPAGLLPTEAKPGISAAGDVTIDTLGIEPQAIPAGLDYAAMVDYANRHWSNYNPDYRTFSGTGGDCTNFVSQIMRHGGWTMVTGWYQSPDAWWYNALNQSYTWAGAENWSQFAPKRTVALTNVWQMTIADVLQYDLGPNGNMNHTMFATKKLSNEIYMTYHSNNTHNKPLSEIIAAHPSGIAWYAYRT